MLLGAAVTAYTVAGGLSATRTDYRALLGMQAASVGLLVWMRLQSFKYNTHNAVLHTVILVLITSLVARGATAVALADPDINRAAKMNRWDTLATNVAYAATLGFAFRALVPAGKIPGGRGWLGTVVLLVAVPTLTAVVTSFMAPSVDDNELYTTADLSNRVYTEHTFVIQDTDTQVLVVHDGDVTYVAFAGTASRTDVKTDLKVTDVHPEWADTIHPKLRVHAGFAKAWASARAKVLDIHATGHVITCGHSLGGALAMLAALDIAVNSNPRRVSCYTYGAPAVGDQLFADAYNARVAHSVRVVVPLDPVPKSTQLQFVHVRGLYPVATVAYLNPHDMLVYMKGVTQPRSLEILGVALPVVYIALALAVTGGAVALRRRLHS